MSPLRFKIVFWFFLVYLVLSAPRAHAGVTGGVGIGPLIFVKDNRAEFTYGLTAFFSRERLLGDRSKIMFDFEITPNGKANLFGATIYVGPQLQHRIGPFHIGLGPGFLAGAWLLTPGSECQDDCVGGIGAISSIAFSGEIGFALHKLQNHRMDWILRTVASAGKVKEIQIFQIYMGIRIY